MTLRRAVAARRPALEKVTALRVLVRLGRVREGGSYARTYATARRLAEPFSSQTHLVQEAHQLLKAHGQSLCKRNAPRCKACLLARECAHARRDRPTPPAAQRVRP